MLRSLLAHIPVNGGGGVRSGIVADPEASPVQLHGDVIVVSFVQQHSTVFISGNLRQQQAAILVTSGLLVARLFGPAGVYL